MVLLGIRGIRSGCSLFRSQTPGLVQIDYTYNYYPVRLLAKLRTGCSLVHRIEAIGPSIPDSKVHGANMGPTRGRQDPGGPHVDPHELCYLG